MDELDYMEKSAEASGKERIERHAELKRHAHTLMTLLLGGGGAMGAYGLGMLERNASGGVPVALLGASIWCFALSACALLGCLRPRAVEPFASDPAPLWTARDNIAADPPQDGDLLRELRTRELGRRQRAAEQVAAASAAVAANLNRCYGGALLTPLAACVALPLWGWLKPHIGA